MADESWIWIHRYVRVVANAASAPSPLKVRQHGKARELFLATHNFDREIQRCRLAHQCRAVVQKCFGYRYFPSEIQLAPSK
jgi:hypothetical protein